VTTAVRHLQAAVSLSGDWLCRTTRLARFDLGPRGWPTWSCNAFTAHSRRVRRIDQEACRDQHAMGVAESTPRRDRQRSCNALGIAGRFPQIRAGRAVWRRFWLDGNACQGNREGE
jgi:hypothetical protein